MEWFSLLVLETRGYIYEVGFELVVILFPIKTASATLAQCLIERWWDTIHTFHIAEQEMTVTSYDFYHGLAYRHIQLMKLPPRSRPL